jgi:hypothetical protein
VPSIIVSAKFICPLCGGSNVPPKTPIFIFLPHFYALSFFVWKGSRT